METFIGIYCKLQLVYDIPRRVRRGLAEAHELFAGTAIQPEP
jgi:hypothetical protein